MNLSGITRILELFTNDIDHIEYEVDGVTATQGTFETSVTNDEVSITFDIPIDDVGLIDNIKIVGSTQTYENNISTNFNKTNDKLTINLVYRLYQV